MSDDLILGCKQSSCNVSGDGKCIEGRSLNDCPYIIRQTTVTMSSGNDGLDAVDGASDIQFVPMAKHLRLYLGDELTARFAHPIMSANLTRVVAIAGGQECGKTSLLTCLYDHFQKGPYAGYLFAGSKTLMGFEKRCFTSRLTSGRSEPITERTQNVDDFRFLHLALRKEQLDTSVQHLLISDVTGEAFNAARKTTEAAEKLALFRRADHFVLMIDGANIASADFKHNEIQQMKTLVRALVQVNVITSKTLVDLVINKWDLILAAPDTNDLQVSLDELSREIESRYAKNMAELHTYRIAALPRTDVVERGFGIGHLLESWMETSVLLQEDVATSNDELISLYPRSFDRFRCLDV